ncbi:MAG: holo-ACP synthase [Aureliella sp.]
MSASRHVAGSIYGIGTDITECVRIAQMIDKHGELFLTRVYTQQEIAYCSARRSAIQHYAGRWAAKEAVLKSIGTGWSRGIHWTDIEVVNAVGGKPSIVIGGAARQICEQRGIGEVLISISHSRNYAIAYATAIFA